MWIQDSHLQPGLSIRSLADCPQFGWKAGSEGVDRRVNKGQKAWGRGGTVKLP
jgi:hypothetical protein